MHELYGNLNFYHQELAALEERIDWNLLVAEEEAKKKGDEDQDEEEDDELVAESVTLDHDKDYQLPPPIKEDRFSATVTYVDFNCVIHAQDLNRDLEFQTMVKKMKRYLDKTSNLPEETVFSVGDLCSVFYEVNKNWYRGKIRGREPNGMYR